MHARCGLARISPPFPLVVFCCEQLWQNTWPHSRQWCLRRKELNDFSHARQAMASLSGTQLAFVFVTSAAPVGTEGNVLGSFPRNCNSGGSWRLCGRP